MRPSRSRPGEAVSGLPGEAVSELPGEAEQAAARSILAEEGGTLLGVITAVQPESKSARIAFAADVEGVVRLEDVKWARVPDPNRLPYPVRSIEDVFTEGDVARFAGRALARSRKTTKRTPTSPRRFA